MSRKTPNIGLALNGVKSEDTQMTFREWRLRVNGEDNDSNMEIIDTEIGTVKKKITELEGQSLSDEDRLKLAKIKDMIPATADGNGEAGFVPAPQSGDQVKYLRGDGTWGVPEGTSKPATENTDGLMSKEDKKKLDQFASADQYAKKDDVPKNVETDTTLTKAATPADAKAVGDRIGSLTANDVGAMPVDADVVKTVNGKQPDQNGDIQIAATGGNIHVGSDNPPDNTYEVWIDPNGEPTEIVDQYAREQLENKLDNTTTAEDIGALPSSTAIPSKTSELQNDSGFVAGTDATLAITGEAADAKATGDAIGQLKEDIVYLSSKTASNETKAYDITDLFTLNGFLTKTGEFVSNAPSLCTDYIDAKKGEIYYLYISQDDAQTLPIAVYNADKSFVKGVENKGKSYQLQYFEYTVEEDCLIRISSMNADSSLIYRKEFKNNSEVFDEINTKIGQIETYYEDKTQYVLEHKTDDKYLHASGVEASYSGGLVSDYIEVDEGDSIKVGTYVLYGNPALVMYYSNKKMYKSFNTADDGFNTVTTVIPPMVKYIRISSLDASKGINFQILRHKSLIDFIKESSKEKNYVIPNTYDELALTNTTSGFIQDSGTIEPNDNYVTSDYIDLDNYDYFRLVSDYAWAVCGYVTFDDNKQILAYAKDSENTIKRLDIVPQDISPTAKYIRFCGSTNKLHVYVKKQTTLITNGLEEALETGNVLYHKKIAFCGDSFTEATNLGKTLYDNFIGCYKSFGWRIANRNKMKLYHDGISGSTMHVVDKENPNNKSPFAYERYKNVPVDCDYIILQFGLNESNIANDDATKGTKDSTDITTMWGAWNTVLGYLIENHPTARIGIIMSDAWMPQSYYTTLKEICEWWGIPLLDLGGDTNVPVMNGGRRDGSGLTLNPKVAELRNATFYNADGDAHPNDKGHEWRSTVIENWIRSL